MFNELVIPEAGPFPKDRGPEAALRAGEWSLDVQLVKGATLPGWAPLVRLNAGQEIVHLAADGEDPDKPRLADALRKYAKLNTDLEGKHSKFDADIAEMLAFLGHDSLEALTRATSAPAAAPEAPAPAVPATAAPATPEPAPAPAQTYPMEDPNPGAPPPSGG